MQNEYTSLGGKGASHKEQLQGGFKFTSRRTIKEEFGAAR